MDKLKRCLICGNEPTFYRIPIKVDGKWGDSVFVKCEKCNMKTDNVLYDEKKYNEDGEYKEAINMWNELMNALVKNPIKCPHCGDSHYSELYSLSTMAYYPLVYKDGVMVNTGRNAETHTCQCMSCGNRFTYQD